MLDAIGLMPKLGIKPVSSIKREALLFDRIALLPPVNDWFDFDELDAELEWLQDNNIVFELPKQALSQETVNELSQQKPELKISWEHLNLLLEDTQAHQALMEELKYTDPLNWYSPLYDDEKLIALQMAEELLLFHEQLGMRVVATQLEKDYHQRGIPIFPKKLRDLSDPTTTKTNVIEVVLNQFPIPDDSTSWEQIIDFRKDKDARDKFRRLVNWINSATHTDQSFEQLEHEIKELCYDYEQHMRIHRMKINFTTLETLVTAISPISLLKWEQLIKPLFALRHREIALLEAELSAPGREIAYIVKVQNEFK